MITTAITITITMKTNPPEASVLEAIPLNKKM